MTHHDSWTLDALIGAYKQHQRRTRGLRERTLHGYERIARPFVRAALGGGPIDPTHFSPRDVIEFVASLRDRHFPRSMKFVRVRRCGRSSDSCGPRDSVMSGSRPRSLPSRIGGYRRYLDI